MEKVVNLSFTCLQTLLTLNCLWIYKRGLTSYSQYKLISSPYLIGIGGNSGVGKTTLSEGISSIFGKHNTSIIRGDDMHKWERKHENWKHLTHLDPKANHLHHEFAFLKKLRRGYDVQRRYYDHN